MSTTGALKLKAFLDENDISLGEFARRIGAKNARTVSRYVAGERIPSHRMMPKVVRETEGTIEPNDFFVAQAAEAAAC